MARKKSVCVPGRGNHSRPNYIAHISNHITFFPIILKRFYLSIFRQRRREEEREGKKYRCVVASCAPATGDLAHNPGMCPNWELNRRSFGLQTGAQSTEPHQPGTFPSNFDLQLDESLAAEPTDTEGWLYFIDELLGSFQYEGVIVIRAAKNILVNIFWWSYVHTSVKGATARSWCVRL